MDYTAQINAIQIQINAIDAQLNATLPDKAKQALIANKTTLQTWYSQLIAGIGLSDTQSTQLQTDISNAKKASLSAAASADQIRMIVIGGISLAVIGLAVWLFRKNRQVKTA